MRFYAGEYTQALQQVARDLDADKATPFLDKHGLALSRAVTAQLDQARQLITDYLDQCQRVLPGLQRIAAYNPAFTSPHIATCQASLTQQLDHWVQAAEAAYTQGTYKQAVAYYNLMHRYAPLPPELATRRQALVNRLTQVFVLNLTIDAGVDADALTQALIARLNTPSPEAYYRFTTETGTPVALDLSATVTDSISEIIWHTDTLRYTAVSGTTTQWIEQIFSYPAYDRTYIINITGKLYYNNQDCNISIHLEQTYALADETLDYPDARTVQFPASYLARINQPSHVIYTDSIVDQLTEQLAKKILNCLNLDT